MQNNIEDYMSLTRDILNVLTADHSFAQKLNYLKYKFFRKQEILGYDPVTISIVGTTRCTLTCDMCPTHSKLVPRDYPHIQRNTRDMDFDMFKEIIGRFKNAINVHIIGAGEPLLNKDFFSMVDYAACKKMVVKTFSNGTTIAKNIDRILNSRLDGITISINGHNPKEFKRMTGMDEKIYSEIYEAAKLLVEEKKKNKSKLKVKLAFIIDRYNYKFISDMIVISLKLDVNHAFFCNFLPSPYDGLRLEERVLMAEDNLIRELYTVFNSYPSSVRKKITPPKLPDAKINKNHCDTHFSQIRFDGDGNVSSCSIMLLNMLGHGNYKEERVWNNSFFRNMRKTFLSGDNRSLPDPCKACPENKGVNSILK